MIFEAIKEICKYYFRFQGLVYKKYLQAVGVVVGKNMKIKGLPFILPCTRQGIVLGNNLVLNSGELSNPLGLNHRCIIRTITPLAKITIGNNVSMSGGAVVARQEITIGNNVMIGANCHIIDSDQHPLAPCLRMQFDIDSIATQKVSIEDNVWLGMNVIVLKGVVIGANSIIGAGSVVSRSIPSNSVAAGNPARVIRNLK